MQFKASISSFSYLKDFSVTSPEEVKGIQNESERLHTVYMYKYINEKHLICMSDISDRKGFLGFAICPLPMKYYSL